MTKLKNNRTSKAIPPHLWSPGPALELLAWGRVPRDTSCDSMDEAYIALVRLGLRANFAGAIEDARGKSVRVWVEVRP